MCNSRVLLSSCGQYNTMRSNDMCDRILSQCNAPHSGQALACTLLNRVIKTLKKSNFWGIRMSKKGLCNKTSPLIVSWPGVQIFVPSSSPASVPGPIKALSGSILHWSVRSGFVVYYFNSHNLWLFNENFGLSSKNVIRSTEIPRSRQKFYNFRFFPPRHKKNSYLEADNWFSGV